MAHLDKAVGGVAIREVCDLEALAVGHFMDAHREEGNRTLLKTFVMDIECGWVRVYALDGLVRRRQEIEEVAKRCADGQAVPYLCDWIRRAARRVRRRRELEEL